MDEIIDKLPTEFLKKIGKEMIERCNYHESHAISEKNIYRKLGYSLNVIIPTLSAIIAFLAGVDTDKSKIVLGLLSLLLAVLAVINSTLKPSERYYFLADKLIMLHDWKFDLNVNLNKLLQQSGNDLDTTISDYFKKKNKEMSEIGLALAKNKMPENNNSEP